MSTKVKQIAYQSVIEHLTSIAIQGGNDNNFEWPISTDTRCAPIYRDLRCGKIIRKIGLSDIRQILGEITIYLPRKDIVIGLDCEIYALGGRTQIDLCYIAIQDTIISATAVSGNNIEGVLQYYANQGVIRLMVAKCGLFWIQKEIRPTNNPN